MVEECDFGGEVNAAHVILRIASMCLNCFLCRVMLILLVCFMISNSLKKYHTFWSDSKYPFVTIGPFVVDPIAYRPLYEKSNAAIELP